MAFTKSANEERWSRLGNALNTLNRSLQTRLQIDLHAYFQTLTRCVVVKQYLQRITIAYFRITDPTSPFHGCLSDSQGAPLRFAPDNHPTAPKGDGVQLSYRSLPSYSDSNVQQRETPYKSKCQLCVPRRFVCDICKYLVGIVPCNPLLTLPRFATQGSFRG